MPEAVRESRPPPGVSPAPSSPAPIPEDDDRLFRRAMTGVAADADRPAARRAPGPAAPPPEDELALAQRFLASIVDGDVPFDLADTDEYVEGCVRGIDPAILDRLRAAEFAVEAHLDLHGLARDDAKRAVRRFLEQCEISGKRCVLLVHGRGLGSPERIPVLKAHLRRWLSRGGIGRRVLAFTTARGHDGGAGAVYVLLRAPGEPRGP